MRSPSASRALRARSCCVLIVLTALCAAPVLAARASNGAAAAAPAPAQQLSVPAPELSAPALAVPAVDDKLRRPLRIAVYDLSASEIEPRVTRVFVESLLAELRKLQRVSVVSLDEVRALIDLEANKQLVGCDAGSCLAEIAEALGADALIVGGMATVDGRTSLALKRIDAHTAEVTASYTQQLTAARGEELLAAVGPAVERLLAEVPLRAGEVRGVAKEVALRLNPPPVPLWGFATAASTAGVAALTTGAAALWWAGADADLRSLFATAQTDVVPGEQVKQQQSRVVLANSVFWGAAAAAAVLGVATAVLVPFTDFAGYGDAP